jgi:hypothetical protein
MGIDELLWKKWSDTMDEYIPQWSIVISYPLALFTIVIIIWHKNASDIFPIWLSKDFVYVSFVYFSVLTILTVQKIIQKGKPERIFKGQWEKWFKGPDKNGIESAWSVEPDIFVIQNRNQYLAYQNGHFHHRFNVSKLTLCKKNKTINFTLKYVIEEHKSNHPRVNELKIKDVAKMDCFEGTETGDETGEYTLVYYKKIYPKIRISEPPPDSNAASTPPDDALMRKTAGRSDGGHA